MKWVIITLALIAISLLLIGIFFDFTNNPSKDLFYGSGTLLLFFVVFPLFLYYRKDKVDMEKYKWKNPKNKLDD